MKSFIAWIGGKSLLAKKIISEFPAEFDRYIEVFECFSSRQKLASVLIAERLVATSETYLLIDLWKFHKD